MCSSRGASVLFVALLAGCSHTDGLVDPAPAQVLPGVGNNAADVRVSILGENFSVKPTQRVGGGAAVSVDTGYRAWLGATELTSVTWIDSRTLVATVPAGLAEGTYGVRVMNPYGRSGLAPGAYIATANRPARLSTSVTASPAQVDVGQEVVLTVLVTNDGDDPATDVVSAIAGLSGGVPATRLIPAHENRSFRWAAIPSAPGTVTFTATAAGTDSLFQQAVTATPSSVTVGVQRPPALRAALTGAPAVLNQGQLLSLTVSVTNAGDATAIGVQPAVPVTSGTGSATLVSGPIPPSADLAGGGRQDFLWTYRGVNAGTVTFTDAVAGVDGNSGAALQAQAGPPVAFTVQVPAQLEVVLQPSAAVVSQGAPLTVTTRVTNRGEAAAVNVRPAQPRETGAGSLALLSGPVPASARVAGDGGQDFVWSYRAFDAGAVALTGTAAGTDATSDAGVTSSVSAPVQVTVVASAALNLTASSVPTAVEEGQSFPVSFTVTNVGASPANNVVAVLNPIDGGVVVSGPAPTSVPNLPASGSQVFSWTARAGSSPGSMSFVAASSGFDTPSGTLISAPTVSGAIPVLSAPGLDAGIVLPAQVFRGSTFTVSEWVSNSGQVAANSVIPVAPALIAGSTGQVSPVSATPIPASATIAPGATATFVWTYSATGVGSVTLAGTAAGTDALTAAPVRASGVSNLAAVVEVANVFIDPFGDGTNFSYVFGYHGLLYLGPRKDGRGAVRSNLDGSAPQAVGFSFFADPPGAGYSTSNSSAAPYPSIGFTGAALNTAAAGPDNEDGRGYFGSGTLMGSEWLLIGGSKSGGKFHYLYLTSDSGTTHPMSYLDMNTLNLEGGTQLFSSAHFFGGSLYLGFGNSGGRRPELAVLSAAPPQPGLEASGSQLVDLRGQLLPALGQSGGGSLTAIDSFQDLNGALYAANSGGCARSTTTPPGDATTWVDCTPSAAALLAHTSLASAAIADMTPADKTTPQMAVYQGKLFAIRNTTVGAQLWSCTPSRSGSPTDCDPADWVLVAPDASGTLSTFNNPNNTLMSMLVATPTALYVGMDNPQGLVVYRTQATDPSSISDFEGRNGCVPTTPACQGLGGNGLGDVPNNTRIFDAVALSDRGQPYVYLVSGNGANAIRVFRIAP